VLRVLLIDDDPDYAELLTMTLRDGIDIVHAATLTDGMRIAMGGHFDATLLDLTLPDTKGGMDTIKKAVGSVPGPIIVLTSSGDNGSMVKEAKNAGATDWASKTMSPQLLERLIRIVSAFQNIIDIMRDKMEIGDARK